MNSRAILHEVYRRERAKPFSWDTLGCIRWPAECAIALTGVDPASTIRGKVATEDDAKRLMAENGCSSLADVAGTQFEEIPISQARDGDWAVVANADGSEGLGVVVGGVIFVSTPDGIGRIKLFSATHAFRVELKSTPE